MAGVMGSLLMFMTGTSTAQDSSTDERVRAATVKEAMAYKFRQTNDPGLLAELLYTVLLHEKDVPTKEIVRRTLDKRSKWIQLRRTGIEGDWRDSRNSEKYKTTARFLGRAASQLAGLGSAGVDAINLAILHYEDYAANKALPRAAQRIAEDFRDSEKRLVSPEGSVFEVVNSYYQNDRKYRETWDALFLPRFGFTPLDSAQTVMKRYPDFSQHEAIVEILKISNDTELLTKRIHELTGEALGEVGNVRRRQQDMDQEEARRRKAQRDALDMKGYRAAADLAAIFVSFTEPDLGRQLHAVSTAVFSVLDGVQAYEKALTLEANPNLAGLALTGNIVTGGLAILAAFQDTGPTGDQIIIEEIGRLREQVQEIRKEMHTRFDGVHDHLDGIYESMIEGFTMLQEENLQVADKLKSVEADLDSVYAETEQHRRNADRFPVHPGAPRGNIV